MTTVIRHVGTSEVERFVSLSGRQGRPYIGQSNRRPGKARSDTLFMRVFSEHLNRECTTGERSEE